MSKVKQLNSIVEILKKEYEKRKSKNPAFSMRRFSKYMDMDPSNLNKIMNYKKPVGQKTIKKICEKLNINRSIWTAEQSLKNAALSKFSFIDDSKKEKYYSFYIDTEHVKKVSDKIDLFINDIEPFLIDRSTDGDAIRLSVIFDVIPKNRK